MASGAVRLPVFHREAASMIYTELMTLPAPFRHTDHEVDGRTYRTFCYAYVTGPEMWEAPSALECRGHTFDITDDGKPLLVSLPMGKFFNIGETACPVDSIDGAVAAMRKLDGSLIMTYAKPDYAFGLKTKMSFAAPQCVEAMAWLASRPVALNGVLDWVRRGYTVCMEWTSPTNRIVVDYRDSRLTVLCVRNQAETLWCPHVRGMDSVAVVDCLNDAAEGVEGFVALFDGGTVAKVKTEWYLKRHRWADAKLKNIVDAVLAGESDDVAALFVGHADLIARLQDIERHVSEVRAEIEAAVARLTRMRGDISRKGFALWARAQCEAMGRPELFPLAMQGFAGEVNYSRAWNTVAKRRALFVDTYEAR